MRQRGCRHITCRGRPLFRRPRGGGAEGVNREMEMDGYSNAVQLRATRRISAVVSGRIQCEIQARFGCPRAPEMPTPLDAESGASLASLRASVRDFSSAVAAIAAGLNRIGHKSDSAEAANVASAEAKARGITAEIRRTAGASAGLAGERKRERDALVGSFSRDLALLQDAASVALHAPAPPSARPAGPARGRRAGGAEEGEEGGGSDEGTALLLAARQRQLEDIDAEVAVGATDEQVRAIASGVDQINAMMLELASLVQEQGVVIDNIEVNVSSAARNVEDGNAELAEANRKQAKSRNTGCCLLATAAAILAVVVLVIVLPSVLA
eukprot:m51a1_g11629 Endosomal Syntaxin B (326) ;mRNA; r:4206-5456